MLTQGTRIIVALCVIALSGCASLGGGSLSEKCSVNPDADRWTATFTNTSSSDITVDTFAVLVFDAAGRQVASLLPLRIMTTVAAGNSYADTEYIGVPPDAASCRVTNVQTS